MPSRSPAIIYFFGLFISFGSSTLFIANNCATQVFLSLVCGTTSTPSTIQHGQRSVLTYPSGPGNDPACSAKVSLDNNQFDVFQFEYSFDGDYNLWWDLSALEGDPFRQYGRTVTTASGSAGKDRCPRKLLCKPGSDACAFLEVDDGPVYWCSRETDITLTLCKT